jgi:two-component system chemotaxis response regulator CheB
VKEIRALVVDDSPYNRQTIIRMLQHTSSIKVIGTASDGKEAISKVIKLRPDVVTLDLEMPRMDGFTFLRWIMKESPIPIIVVSARSDDRSVFKALELGAVDFIVKPTAKASPQLLKIREELIAKIYAVANLEMSKMKANLELITEGADRRVEELSKRPKRVELVAIGASTGGPPAIQAILLRLPKNLPAGIVISQHMPEGFTRHFAERLDRISSLDVKEAEDGEAVESGKALIAPGGYHITLKQEGEEVSTVLKRRSLADKYVPSVDIMMKSAAAVYGRKVLGVILTGMGNDGKVGMKAIKDHKGQTIAESEETSVVFGMPQEVIEAGAADKVLPLKDIPEEIIKRCMMDEK